jgi:hypothetical protein
MEANWFSNCFIRMAITAAYLMLGCAIKAVQYTKSIRHHFAPDLVYSFPSAIRIDENHTPCFKPTIRSENADYWF